MIESANKETEPAKRSVVEKYKGESGGLYGPIARELSQGGDRFSSESAKLLEHHGTYQQDDRDVRKARKKKGLGKKHVMMVRTRCLGGGLTAEQYLACDGLATKYGQGDMRASSRQTLQFHGVFRGNLRPLIHDLNKLAQITTLGSAGDVVRNVMVSPVIDIDPSYRGCGSDLLQLARSLDTAVLPQTEAYYDLWLDDEKAVVQTDGTIVYAADFGAPAHEPLYGTFYLPRKLKIGIAAEFDNAIDAFAQDIGVIAVVKDGAIEGCEVLVGGGLGYSHGQKGSHPQAATPFAFVQTDELLALLRAIVEVQRDCGDRQDRRYSRLRYTLNRMGPGAFRERVFQYADQNFQAPRQIHPQCQPTYLGWHRQRQEGLNYVGVWIPNGRIGDRPEGQRTKSGLRAVIEQFKLEVRITPQNNIVLVGVHDEDVEAVQALLDEHNVPTDHGISTIRCSEMACPALPLCPKALAEAERVLPSIMEGLEAAGHGGADVTIRMTGCPNGCARPATAEIGLVGEGSGRYSIRMGGSHAGIRVNELLLSSVKSADLVTRLNTLLSLWKSKRRDAEGFGDWSHRAGAESLRDFLKDASDG